MSGQIKLNLPSGGSKTIAAPDSAATETITLPAGTKTLLANDSTNGFGVDTNGNAGLGVTPESSETNTEAFEMGSNTAILDRASVQTVVAHNAYIDNTDYKYKNAAQAMAYAMFADGHKFYVAGAGTLPDDPITWTTAMTIDNNGRILVNGSDPWARMGIDATAEYVMRLDRTDGGSSAGMIRFDNAGTQVGSIITSGSTTSYNTSSDYRLKENVTPITGAIDRLNQLKPSRFNFITDPTKVVDGFIAHEAATVVPEAVTGEKDAMKDEEYEVTPAVEATYDAEGNELTPAVEAVMGTRTVPDYQGIDQAKLVPLLTAALQEALTEIDSLKTRVAALEGVA